MSTPDAGASQRWWRQGAATVVAVSGCLAVLAAGITNADTIWSAVGPHEKVVREPSLVAVVKEMCGQLNTENRRNEATLRRLRRELRGSQSVTQARVALGAAFGAIISNENQLRVVVAGRKLGGSARHDQLIAARAIERNSKLLEEFVAKVSLAATEADLQRARRDSITLMSEVRTNWTIQRTHISALAPPACDLRHMESVNALDALPRLKR